MAVTALLEALRAIARSGLNAAENPYDRERYERLLALSAVRYGDPLELPSASVRTAFARELGQITSKVSAAAAIFDGEGNILLEDRVDGGGWCLPGGWVEPNERPVDAALREVREETGLIARACRLVGVFSRAAGEDGDVHSLSAVVHLCEVGGGELTLSSEGLGLRYWPLDEVPRWHLDHEKKARAAHAMWISPETDAISD